MTTMDILAPAVAAVLGVGCLVLALRVVRRGTPVVTATGFVWATARAAGAFWLLLGVALLTVPLLSIGARTGVIGADAGFWLSGAPLLLGLAGVVAFRPRRPAPPAAPGPGDEPGS